jgi:hypothetical protein
MQTLDNPRVITRKMIGSVPLELERPRGTKTLWPDLCRVLVLRLYRAPERSVRRRSR